MNTFAKIIQTDFLKDIDQSKLEKELEKFTLLKIDDSDLTIRDTPFRLTLTYSTSTLNIETNRLSENLKIQGLRLLSENGKGAQLYCIASDQTFEMHFPLELTKQKYDMNDPQENKGLYKLVQLDKEWNFRIYQYKQFDSPCEK